VLSSLLHTASSRPCNRLLLTLDAYMLSMVECSSFSPTHGAGRLMGSVQTVATALEVPLQSLARFWRGFGHEKPTLYTSTTRIMAWKRNLPALRWLCNFQGRLQCQRYGNLAACCRSSTERLSPDYTHACMTSRSSCICEIRSCSKIHCTADGSHAFISCAHHNAVYSSRGGCYFPCSFAPDVHW
jgi:hypothetical protein